MDVFQRIGLLDAYHNSIAINIKSPPAIKSCVGNTWRPPYDLNEEKIAAMQEAAHQAVANLNS